MPNTGRAELKIEIERTARVVSGSDADRAPSDSTLRPFLLGVEGNVSHAIRAAELRQARYLTLPSPH
jgi:hypothetical protein